MDIPEISGYPQLRSYCTQAIQNTSIDFIASAKYPLSTLSVDAFLNTYDNQKQGLIIIKSRSSTSEFFISTTDFDQTDNHDVTFVRYRPKRRESLIQLPRSALKLLRERSLSSVGGCLHCLHSSDQQTIDVIGSDYRRFFPMFVATLSTYTPRYHTFNVGLKRYRNGPPQPPLFETALSSYINVQRYNLLSYQNDNSIQIDGSVAKLYQDALPDVDPDPNTVLLITQPFSEHGDLSETGMIEFVQDAVNDMATSFENIYIKTHHKERSSKYESISNATLIESDEPIERLIPDIAPSAVVGFTSTALFTVSAFYDINCYTLTDRFPAEISDELIDCAAFIQSYNQRSMSNW